MNRFDDNFFRELRADAEAHVANLANDVGLLGEKSDFLFLAKAHFAETMSDFGGGGELFDADGGSCANVT